MVLLLEIDGGREACVRPNDLPLSRERRTPCYRFRTSRARRSSPAATG